MASFCPFLSPCVQCSAHAKLERLEKLGELKEKGLLTAAEFREEKKKILSG